MRRRQFIAGLAGTAAWPLAARAQQRALPVIGYLSSLSAVYSQIETVPFLQALKETGYVEGQNLHRSNTAGRKINLIGCRRLQPISSASAYR